MVGLGDCDEAAAIGTRTCTVSSRATSCTVLECVHSLMLASYFLQILEKAAEIAGASDCMALVSVTSELSCKTIATNSEIL